MPLSEQQIIGRANSGRTTRAIQQSLTYTIAHDRLVIFVTRDPLELMDDRVNRFKDVFVGCRPENIIFINEVNNTDHLKFVLQERNIDITKVGAVVWDVDIMSEGELDRIAWAHDRLFGSVEKTSVIQQTGPMVSST